MTLSPKEQRNAAYKQQVLEELWLQYYNLTLRKKGVISEDIFRKMRTQILQRRSRKSG